MQFDHFQDIFILTLKSIKAIVEKGTLHLCLSSQSYSFEPVTSRNELDAELCRDYQEIKIQEMVGKLVCHSLSVSQNMAALKISKSNFRVSGPSRGASGWRWRTTWWTSAGQAMKSPSWVLSRGDGSPSTSLRAAGSTSILSSRYGMHKERQVRSLFRCLAVCHWHCTMFPIPKPLHDGMGNSCHCRVNHADATLFCVWVSKKRSDMPFPGYAILQYTRMVLGWGLKRFYPPATINLHFISRPTMWMWSTITKEKAARSRMSRRRHLTTFGTSGSGTRLRAATRSSLHSVRRDDIHNFSTAFSIYWGWFLKNRLRYFKWWDKF